MALITNGLKRWKRAFRTAKSAPGLPLPTGYMHVGNQRTALYTYLIARHAKGKFILSIEDTDQKRKVEDAGTSSNAQWTPAGLDYDEGSLMGGPCGPLCADRAHGLL